GAEYDDWNKRPTSSRNDLHGLTFHNVPICECEASLRNRPCSQLPLAVILATASTAAAQRVRRPCLASPRRVPRCRDSTLVACYRSLYAPRTGGAHDSHHRTAGIAGRARRRGGSVAARGARAAGGDAGRWVPRE